MDRNEIDNKENSTTSFKKWLFSWLLIFSPLWLPILTAYTCVLLSYVIGQQTTLFGFTVYAAIIFSYFSGLISLFEKTKLKIISFLLYTPIAIIVLFFTGWGSLLTATKGH